MDDLGSLESTQEADLELLSAIALNNSYAFFLLSKRPAWIHNLYTHAKHQFFGMERRYTQF